MVQGPWSLVQGPRSLNKISRPWTRDRSASFFRPVRVRLWRDASSEIPPEDPSFFRPVRVRLRRDTSSETPPEDQDPDYKIKTLDPCKTSSDLNRRRDCTTLFSVLGGRKEVMT